MSLIINKNKTMLVILNVSLCNYRYTMHLFGKNKYKKERKKKEIFFFFIFEPWQRRHSANSYWRMSSKLQASVQFSHSVLSDSLWPHGLQHARPPCPSPTPGAYSNSCPSCQWCHPTTSASAVPFYSCLQSFPPSGFFFTSELILHIRWLKYWSFSFIISPPSQ